MQPQALGLSYSFDAAEEGDPYPVTIRFDGRRIRVNGRPAAGDRFETTTTVGSVLPGSGRITVTARVTGIPIGEWEVRARPVRESRARDRRPTAMRPTLPTGSAVGVTRWEPVVQVRAPGVRLGAWPGFVTTGAAVALIVQALLARHEGVSVAPLVLVSLAACLIGLVGAKAYYIALHPRDGGRLQFRGMCIQGFVLAAGGSLMLGSWLAGLPVGTVLDVSTPGLMLGMAIGRFGCFFGGCCAGRPTASRWGLWSSDRHLGVRRIPTQLLESALAATLAAVALAVLLGGGAPRPAGVVFVGTLAAYTLGRQLLFPLRGLPRQTAHGRLAAMIAAAAVLIADVLVGVLI